MINIHTQTHKRCHIQSGDQFEIRQAVIGGREGVTFLSTALEVIPGHPIAFAL